MTTQPKVLDASNSRLYVSRPRPKRAVLRWTPASYQLSWGVQQFEGPHMLVDDEYGVDLEVFFATHRPIPEREDHYVKVAKVRAVQVTEETDLDTIVRGHEEMKAKVREGGWIIQNPSGELYYNTPEEFESRYEPCEED